MSFKCGRHYPRSCLTASCCTTCGQMLKFPSSLWVSHVQIQYFSIKMKLQLAWGLQARENMLPPFEKHTSLWLHQSQLLLLKANFLLIPELWSSGPLFSKWPSSAQSASEKSCHSLFHACGLMTDISFCFSLRMTDFRLGHDMAEKRRSSICVVTRPPPSVCSMLHQRWQIKQQSGCDIWSNLVTCSTWLPLGFKVALEKYTDRHGK